MKIGSVKELKNLEYRVGLTPKAVTAYVEEGHTVYIESNAGLASGFNDDLYIEAGAKIFNNAKDVWSKSDMIVKVKEPLKEEYQYLRKGLILFSYLHLAANQELTLELIKKEVTAVAYETIKDETGLPCLLPMSELAGKLSVLEGSRYLYKNNNGLGIFLGGTSTVKAANVVIIGAGTVGMAALDIAYSLKSHVTILDINQARLKILRNKYPKLVALQSNEENIIRTLKDADLVITAVLLPGGKTPKLIKTSYYEDMKKGTVIVDVAIDQGGALEASRETTHENPTFEVNGIVHYAVPNITGIVPFTSTKALNNATLKFGLKIANLGIKEALKESDAILYGLNTYQGHLTIEGVAKAFDMDYKFYDLI